MFRAVYFIVLTLWSVASVYAVVKPVYEDDPELFTNWPVPEDFEGWYTYTDGAKFLGYLFAGRAEFPWIVDIRDPDQDQEHWSVGNLLDSLHVLTCCRCVFIYTNDGGQQRREISKTLKVSFAPTYLWENYIPTYYKNIRPLPILKEHAYKFSKYQESGTRAVKYIHMHPRCRETLSHDLAILRLTIRIPPFLPIVLYMRLFLQRVNGNPDDPVTVVNFKFTNHEENRLVCYIGAFGRDWRNWADHIVVDYKVRYRAYYEPMETCLTKLSRVDRNNDDPSPSYPHQDFPKTQNLKIDQENTLCFTTRARVGTVCDHDSGAPLVCNGWVVGFLVRGARWQYCNNLLPMPFIVVKIGIANTYYDDAIDAYEYNKVRDWTYVDYGLDHGVMLYHPRFYLNTFLIIFHMTKFQFFTP